QRLFGSQRALKSVEDFTEFEQRAAYFDGDPVQATKKGVNILERGSQVHFMAEMEELFDFPPAPKVGVDGKLDPAKASPAELRGQELFFGKAKCAACHVAPARQQRRRGDPRQEQQVAERVMRPRAAEERDVQSHLGDDAESCPNHTDTETVLYRGIAGGETGVAETGGEDDRDLQRQHPA